MILLNKAQSVATDNFAMNNLGIPSIILMENAAKSSAEIISTYINKNDVICILCGSGNNGGDGFAIARHLKALEFINVTIAAFGDINKMSAETRLNFEITKKLEIPIYEIKNVSDFRNSFKNVDCFIESLIGIGGNEKLRGDIIEILREINNCSGFKVAIDVPAGMNADTGKYHSDAFRANLTITMFAPKIGMYLLNVPDICGIISTANLGFPQSVARKFATTFCYTQDDIRKIIPHRKNHTSKFDYGKVLIIAGSEKYPGAAALTANACVRAGAGLVYLASTAFHHSLFPEVIQIKLESNSDGTISENSFEVIAEYIGKADSIAIGPGIGTNSNTMILLNRLLNDAAGKPTVIDAEGLRCLSIEKPLSPNFVLTPHIYEFAKLISEQHQSVSDNFYDLANQFSKKLNCVIHLKSVPAVTSDGDQSFLTINGNPGMSSGGSGDVLTGIIAAFLGAGLSPFVAASFGAYIHSRAGDKYVEKNSQESLRASDLINYLSKSFNVD